MGKLKIKLLLPAMLLMMSPLFLQAQESTSKPDKPTKLFSATEVMNVTLTAPWQKIVKNKRNQGAYPARLDYTDEFGRPVSLKLTVERRGVKRQDVCRFPPIKLRFEKEQVKGTAFRGQKSIKMVTHCEKASRFEQYYVTEMLAYRMYNLLTDYSFRVRQLKVNYVDSESNPPYEGRFAFLIEDDSDVAKRNDLKKLVIPAVDVRRLDTNLTSEMAVFQYLIGNVDWAALSGPDPEECCHNVKLIAPRPLQPGDIIYPIPYDFDSSGLVNPDYAAPPDSVPIKFVTQRLFRGYCRQNHTLGPAREKILSHRAAILALVDNEPLLNSSKRKSVANYLERGFEILEDPKDFEKNITEKCRM